MSFVANAVAGPSRVRSARTALNVAVCVRHQSSNTRAPRGYEPRELTQEDLDRKEYDDAVAAYHQKLNRSAREPAEREANYEAWLKTVGARYLQHRPGTKATWLGESVPFPANPSFQPPPPISDVIMSEIDQELRSGKKTVGQIATQFSVSKARIEAIRKLKEVEAEFKRQGLPLNEGFQYGMERLLGCKIPYELVRRRKEPPSPQAVREEEIARVGHQSTDAEIEEEERGKMGSFGDLRKQSDSQGLEKEAWAFVSEAEYVAGTSAAQQAMDAASEHAPRPPKPEFPSNYNKPGKNVYRFIDTSKQGKKPAAGKQQPIKK